jgi:long-chain acyl-CoA synthetase
MDDEQTIPRRILELAARRGGRPALRHKVEGHYRPVSWQELDLQVRTFARALLALGLRPGERVAIMANNGPEWVFADQGIMAAGGVSVPVYHTEGLDAALHILRDSGSRFLFLYSPLLAREWAERLPEVPQLERIILLEGEPPHTLFMRKEEFLRQAAAVAPTRLDETLASGRAEDLATLVYTSGTTGFPKGVMLSHRNFLSNVAAATELFAIGDGDECLSFLPLSHVFERMAGYYLMLLQGAVIAYAESVDLVPANLAEVRPTVLISVPRLYEKMYARIMERALGGGALKKQVFFGALHLCQGLVRKQLRGEQPGMLLRRSAEIARSLVFAKLRAPLGGRLRFFVSGGAPLGRDIAEFFLAVGVPIYEGYGLTETAPVLAANSPAAIRPGTVGRPLPGVHLRIAEDGEILAQGPGVFQGYWGQPEETRAAFTEGWFRTGDIGEIDADGFLAITDRKKDLIVTAGGENVAPQFLEGRFKSDKFIAGAVVFGDRKPFLTALLVPNFENVEKFARTEGIPFLNHCDLVSHPRILELIRQRVDLVQEGFPPFQRIKRFTLLSRDFQKDEVTPTLKVRRKEVFAHFGTIVEGMYLPTDHAMHDSAFCVVEPDAAGGINPRSPGA